MELRYCFAEKSRDTTIIITIGQFENGATLLVCRKEYALSIYLGTLKILVCRKE